MRAIFMNVLSTPCEICGGQAKRRLGFASICATCKQRVKQIRIWLAVMEEKYNVGMEQPEEEAEKFRSRMTAADWALTAFVWLVTSAFAFAVMVSVWQWLQEGGVQ
jgi:hypothetical protein